MRFVVLAAALGIAIPAAGEGAAQAASTAAHAQLTAESHDARLDMLFGQLKRAGNEADAKIIADQIWAEWRDSGGATVDLLMQWAGEATKKKDYAAALDFLDQVTVLAPEFAEGWNQRATVHFLMHDYAKSMADIETTLSLEPRHFGAISGMGAIFQAVGKKKLALDAYERALAIYPMLRQAQEAVVKLTQDLAGSPT
jgi:tetratricopeptide (TPR) repeat protein